MQQLWGGHGLGYLYLLLCVNRMLSPGLSTFPLMERPSVGRRGVRLAKGKGLGLGGQGAWLHTQGAPGDDALQHCRLVHRERQVLRAQQDHGLLQQPRGSPCQGHSKLKDPETPPLPTPSPHSAPRAPSSPRVPRTQGGSKQLLLDSQFTDKENDLPKAAHIGTKKLGKQSRPQVKLVGRE